MNKKYEHPVLMIIMSLIFILFAVIYFMMYQYFRQMKQETLESYIDTVRDEYDITTSAYSKTADLIFETLIDTKEIKDAFAAGITAENPEETAKYRRLLFNELEGLYKILQNYNFRQLHFHDGSNISYLRFHRPEKFGDDLTGVRASVEYVNRTHQKAVGFEEGRIFNGYRYVYPVSYESRHLGSVEISISVKTIIDQIENTFRHRAQFILLKQQMEQKVFESELDNYFPWTVDPRYVLDRNIADYCIFENNISETDSMKISRLLDRNGKSDVPFSLEAVFDRKGSVISFLPVKNFLDEDIAYMISVSDDDRIKEVKDSFRFISIIYFGLFALIIFLATFYTHTRRRIEKILQTDQLTQADNRRILLEKIDDESTRYLRYRHPFSIIMLDIDHFKKINDTYGHLKGDYVLKNLSQLIKEHIRETDTLGRYGGEEFIIIMPETKLEEAATAAENLRKAIENRKFLESETVTVSMGIAESFIELASIENLIEIADKNLYKAKEDGRNRVCY